MGLLDGLAGQGPGLHAGGKHDSGRQPDDPSIATLLRTFRRSGFLHPLLPGTHA